MDDTPVTPADGALRWLKWLVIALTAAMLVGLIVLIALFVTRFPAPAQIELPETVALPPGTAATAFTRGTDWFAVVLDGREIAIYDAATGALRQRIEIGQ